MAKAQSESDPLILEALEKAFRQSGEVPLFHQGKASAGVFANNQTGKRLAQNCLAESEPLLQVTRTERIRDKEQQYVTITPKGIDFLAQRVPAARRQELMDGTRVPPERAAAMIRACIRLADRRYESLMTEVRATLQSHRQTVTDLQQAVRAFADRVTESIRHVQEDLEAIRGDSTDLRDRLERIDIPAPPEPGEGDRHPPDEAMALPDAPLRFVQVAADDHSFELALNLAKEMVFAWSGASDEDTRAVIEGAMYNGGLQPIGEVGQTVRFDTTFHEGNGPKGAEVEVVQPGWLLEGPKSRHVLARAKVKSKDLHPEVLEEEGSAF